ncbi:MAG: hypothetical protein KatS3mg105_5109 [Gemmatales bacterium]|nr:MAG: hypothetical protein KatS3mg105_5109 [Gemmatales bacterium]
MNVLRLILGTVVLLAGRSLFWLFVGIAGFLAGMDFAGTVLQQQSQWVALLVGVVCGVFGAILAMFVERVAFALAGFFAGNILALSLVANFGGHDSAQWVAVIGGVIGALVAWAMMDWALVILSSLVGAAVVATEIETMVAIDPMLQGLIFAILAAIGISVQSAKLRSASRDTQQG